MMFVRIKLRVKITGEVVNGYLYADLDDKVSVLDNGLYRSFNWSDVTELSRRTETYRACTL